MKKTKEKENKLATKNKSICPIHQLVSLLSGPWTIYILWLIKTNKTQRFGELRKAMPLVSAKMLTQRLRMLEKEEILDREQSNSIPPKVTYSLTKKGKELGSLIDEVNSLATKWYIKK